MPVPVICQPCFKLEPLAGQPQVLRQRAARGADLAERLVARPPDIDLARIGEHDRPVQMVDMHSIELFRRGHGVDRYQRHAIHVDRLAQGIARRPVGLGDDLAKNVPDIMSRAIAGGRCLVAHHPHPQPLERIIGVSALRDDAFGAGRNAPCPVDRVGKRAARAAIVAMSLLFFKCSFRLEFAL
jgi:hypothetical protein